MIAAFRCCLCAVGGVGFGGYAEKPERECSGSWTGEARPFLTFHSHYMVNLKTQDALYRGQLTAFSTHISCSHDMHILQLGFSLNGSILHSPSVIAGYTACSLNKSGKDGARANGDMATKGSRACTLGKGQGGKVQDPVPLMGSPQVACSTLPSLYTLRLPIPRPVIPVASERVGHHSNHIFISCQVAGSSQ